MKTTVLPSLFLAAAVSAAPAFALDLRPTTVFVQAGAGQDSLASGTVGVRWPMGWKANALGGEFSASTEAYLSFWRARDFGGGNQSFTQVALVPYLRYTFDGGRSPWFAELGIGISTTDKKYVTPSKTFSTRFQFSDNIAVGRAFGENNRHEVSLRIQHISNAGIKSPNPGEEFVQLRYAVGF